MSTIKPTILQSRFTNALRGDGVVTLPEAQALTLNPTAKEKAELKRLLTQDVFAPDARAYLEKVVGTKVKVDASVPRQVPPPDAATVKAHLATIQANAMNLAVEATVKGVTGKSFSQAMDTLGALSPELFRRTMGRMSRDGSLEDLLKPASPEQRQAFVSMAVDKGWLDVSETGPARSLPFNPPVQQQITWTSPKVTDSTQPSGTRVTTPSLNGAVHAFNTSAAARYQADYGAYAQRYMAAVHSAPDVQSLRDLGPPARNTAGAPSTAIADAVADRLHQLTGTRRPGTVFIEAEVELKVGVKTPGGLKVGMEAKQSGTVDGSGVRADDTVISGAVTRGESGIKASSEGVEVGVAGKNGGAKVSDKSAEVTIGKVGIAVDGEGGVEAKVPGGYARYSPGKGDVAMGVELEHKYKRGDLELEAKAKLGVGLQLLPHQVVENALDPTFGFHSLPAELARKVPWEGLEPALRGKLESYGWTATEWSARMSRD